MSQRSVEDNLVVQYGNLMATTLACDCTGQFAALCGPKTIALVNLDNPNEILKTFTRNSRHRFCCVQWNPFYSHIFLVANSQLVELWLWDAAGNSGCQKTTLKGHTLQVNDFDWSPIDQNLAATCSADTNTCLWDVRDVRRPTSTLQSVVCPSQVKWNRLCESILATTHEGDLKIWDLRKSNTPVNYISAHERKVSGLDWSPYSDHQVATCSEDGFVKFWDITSQKPEEDQISSSSPFWKIKYMPFGNGVVTSYVPQARGSLCFWTLNRLLSHPYRRQPLCTFGSHSGEGTIIDFCWRSVNSDYQLLSWSSEQSLRLYRIDNLTRQRCGNGLYSSFMASNSCESTPDREIAPETGDPNDMVQSTVNEKMLNSSSLRRRKKGGNGPMAIQPDGGGGGGGLSVENARTLMQEFALLNVDIPDLTITEMSIEMQKLTVDVVKGGGVHQVHLTMSFPTSYPNKVAPEFHLSEETTLDRSLQQKLIEDLQSTALQHVQYSRRCIEPCLWKLVNSLDSIIQDSRTSPDVNPSYLPMQEIWAPYSQEKLRDENVPFPRISGARFCGPGFLVCFTRRMFLDTPPSTNIVVSEPHKRKQSESGITPRAMSALTEMTQPTRIPSAGNMMRSFLGGGTARSLPSDSNVPSVSQYYKLQDQRPLKSKSKPRMMRDQKPVLSRSTSTTKKNPVGPVIVYDLSCLLPIQKLLGENYVFDQKDPVSMCRRNAQVAAAAGRKDLVQVWSLAGVQVAYAMKSSVFGLHSTPWSLHPFGQSLIKFWFNYYSSIRDIQTLAMLCCVFGSISPSKPITPASLTSASTPVPATPKPTSVTPTTNAVCIPFAVCIKTGALVLNRSWMGNDDDEVL